MPLFLHVAKGQVRHKHLAVAPGGVHRRPFLRIVGGGHGLMCALELVSDRKTKAPVDKTTIADVHRATYEAGTMVRVSGPNVIFSPPLVVTEDHVSKMLTSLEAGFQAVS